jgi:hypothetical protein
MHAYILYILLYIFLSYMEFGGGKVPKSKRGGVGNVKGYRERVGR